MQEEREAIALLKGKHSKSLVQLKQKEEHSERMAEALTSAVHTSREAENRRSMSQSHMNRQGSCMRHRSTDRKDSSLIWSYSAQIQPKMETLFISLLSCRLSRQERDVGEAMQLLQATQKGYSVELARVTAAQQSCNALTRIAEGQVQKLLDALGKAQNSMTTFLESYKAFEDSLARGASSALLHDIL